MTELDPGNNSSLFSDSSPLYGDSSSSELVMFVISSEREETKLSNVSVENIILPELLVILKLYSRIIQSTQPYSTLTNFQVQLITQSRLIEVKQFGFLKLTSKSLSLAVRRLLPGSSAIMQYWFVVLLAHSAHCT